jgi:hypothetical protein
MNRIIKLILWPITLSLICSCSFSNNDNEYTENTFVNISNEKLIKELIYDLSDSLIKDFVLYEFSIPWEPLSMYEFEKERFDLTSVDSQYFAEQFEKNDVILWSLFDLKFPIIPDSLRRMSGEGYDSFINIGNKGFVSIGKPAFTFNKKKALIPVSFSKKRYNYLVGMFEFIKSGNHWVFIRFSNSDYSRSRYEK